MDYKGVTERLVSGFAWQGATKTITQALTWLSTIVVARLVAPEDYGIVAVAGVVVTVLEKIVEMGIAPALIQKREVSSGEENGVFYLSLMIGITLYACLYWAAPRIAQFYSMPTLSGVLRLVGVILVLGSLKSVPLAIAMRRMDFRYRSLVEMFSNLGSAALIIVLAFHGLGVWSLAWGIVALNLIMVIGYLPLLGRVPSPRFSLSKVYAVVRYGVQIMGAHMTYIVYARADVFIAGKMLGGVATGYYSMATKIADIPLDKIASIFTQVGFSAFARVQDQVRETKQMYLELERALMTISLPLLFGILAVAHDAVIVLLSDKWLPIVPVLQVLCVLNALRVSATLASPVLNSRGRASLSLRYNLVSLIVLPTAYYIGASFGHVADVAIARLCAYPILYVGLLYFLFREIGCSLSEFWSAVRSPLAATALMLVAIEVLENAAAGLHPGLRLVAAGALGAAVYTGSYLVFFPQEVRKARSLLSMLKGKAVARA